MNLLPWLPWLAGWHVLGRISRSLVVLDRPVALDPARLSVVIPARNEAHNLPRLLRSLEACGLHDVVVVDDHSTDGTSETALKNGAKVIEAEPLPDGWRGKPWACLQGAHAASGSHLLFLDADTWLEPGGLELLLTQYAGGVLSVGPYHQTRAAYEQLSAFFNLSMVAGTIPRGLFGQCLLLDRADYERIGGHESVRDKVLENFHLARRFKNSGIPIRSLAGRGILSVRMYPGGPGELVEGWTKGFSAGAASTPKGVLILIVCWYIGLVLPVVLLPFYPQAGLLYAACVIQVFLVLRAIGRFSILTPILYPIPLAFYFALFARSVRRSGKTVTWKGRDIRAD